MNILAGIGILLGSFVLLTVFGLLIAMTANPYNEERAFVITLVVTAVLSVLITVGSAISFDDSNRAYTEIFNAKKTTIEQSLNSDVLSGLERIELVKMATEMNGDLASRKYSIKRWYTITSDKNMFDDLEYIKLD